MCVILKECVYAVCVLKQWHGSSEFLGRNRACARTYLVLPALNGSGLEFMHFWTFFHLFCVFCVSKPQVVPNLYEFIFSVEHNIRYFEECW